MEAYVAIIFLAYGVGTCVGVIGMFYPMVLTLWQLVSVCLYLSSGALFVAANLPDQITDVLSYNSITVSVEWMRTAFYESYSDKLVDPAYVVAFGGVSLFLGLGIERIFRRQMLDWL